MKEAETQCCSGFGVGIKKIRQSCELPDFYEGWVSKHNPYTILERKFSTKKLFIAFRK
jgi:hypothetical protein